MPTGYTSDIYDGKDVTFREYALKCAGAFGAYVTLHDSPMVQELPTQLEPSIYYRDRLDDAAKRVQELIAMTQAERNVAASEEQVKNMKRWKESEQKNYELSAKYDAMLVEARKFKTPTPEHDRFAQFLIDQLEEAKRWDCHTPGEKWYTEPVQGSGTEWYSKQLENATKNVTYYSEKWEKEVKRTNENNQWIKDLFRALDNFDAVRTL